MIEMMNKMLLVNASKLGLFGAFLRELTGREGRERKKYMQKRFHRLLLCSQRLKSLSHQHTPQSSIIHPNHM